MPGGLSVLNVGAGDLRFSFDPSDPVERERAGRVVRDMLARVVAAYIRMPARDDYAPGYRYRADLPGGATAYTDDFGEACRLVLNAAGVPLGAILGGVWEGGDRWA